MNNKHHSSILIDSLHHAREPVSLNMNIYLNARLIYGLLHQEEDIKELLQYTVIYTIPVVNVDSYMRICDSYDGRG